MLPTRGVFAMTKMLSKRDVKERVLYSFAHIDRLEKAGLFPQRIRLGQNRVGWREEDIENWLQERVEATVTDRSE